MIELTGDTDIRLLHPERDPGRHHDPIYRLAGDAAALGALVECLS